MLRKLFIAFSLTLSISMLSAQTGPATITLVTPNDSLSYAFGLLIGNNLKVQQVENLRQDVLCLGLSEGLSQTGQFMSLEDAGNYIQNYFDNKSVAASSENLAKGKAYLVENGKKPGVVTLPSGLQYQEITPGSGKSPRIQDVVKVHYTGKLIDGSVFDSSIERGEPIEFPVNGVIPGWTEALVLMKEGSRWMLYIPSDLAYGENGAGGVIGPNEVLIFEVELLEVIGE